MKKTSVNKLGRAMKWQYKTDTKLRSYGETDFAKKTIRVNKKRAKARPLYKRPVNKGAQKYPDVLATMVHELRHKTHPHESEKQVLQYERKTVKKLTPKQKKRVYAKFA